MTGSAWRVASAHNPAIMMAGPPLPTSVFALGELQVMLLAEALGFSSRVAEIQRIFGDMAARCGDRPLELPPLWCGFSDDCTPFECSVAFERERTQLRFLLEARTEPASARAYWDAGMRLNQWLAERLDVDLSRFDAIADLFAPIDSRAYWCMWHAIELDPVGAPEAKIYLNPMAAGRDQAARVTEEALTRLGLRKAWGTLAEAAGEHDGFGLFSLDLAKRPDARVKVYMRHRNISLDRLETIYRLGEDAEPGDARHFAQTVTGARDVLAGRPVLSAFNLVGEARDRPVRITLHIPMLGYAENDRVANDRIRVLLGHHGISSEPYDRCIAALSRQPLEQQEGLHSYVSLQRVAGKPRVNVYFCGLAYRDRFGWLGLDPVRWWPSPTA
jgi:DMATS type aromatic prenyltransferase